MAVQVTRGYAAGAPPLKAARSAFDRETALPPEEARWLSLALWAAADLWDDGTWRRLATRELERARKLGALTAIPLVLSMLSYLRLGDRNAAAAAAEAALAAAEPDRLIFPFAMTASTQLLDALPGHETAHGALLADILDLLRGSAPISTDRARSSQIEDLSPTELRVLRYLPTNLTRPEIARELYVSINTVNTHIRNIYSKLGARDRSSAVQRARGLRLVSTRRA